MIYPYPASRENIPAYAERRGISVGDADRRFLAYCVLRAIAEDATLTERMILRGSGALWLVYGHSRLPYDIDIVDTSLVGRPRPEQLKAAKEAVQVAMARFFLTNFPDYQELRHKLLKYVAVQISTPYMSIGFRPCALRSGATLRVAELELLLAEKLVAMAMQPHVPQYRANDPMDVMRIVRQKGQKLDLSAVRRYIGQRSDRQKRVPVSAKEFEQVVLPWCRQQWGDTEWQAQSELEQAWRESIDLMRRIDHVTHD